MRYLARIAALPLLAGMYSAIGGTYAAQPYDSVQTKPKTTAQSSAKTPNTNREYTKYYMPCVEEISSKNNPDVSAFSRFLVRSSDIRRTIGSLFNRLEMSEDEIYNEIIGMRKSSECEILFAIYLPPEDEYKKYGREMPVLDGTFEEQVRTYVRESKWYKVTNTESDMRARAKAPPGYSFYNMRQALCRIPDSVMADVNIDGAILTGKVLPKFSLKDADGGVVYINRYIDVPEGIESEHITSARKYRIILNNGWNTAVPLSRDGSLDAGVPFFTAAYRDALVRYLDAEDGSGSFSGRSRSSVCSDPSQRFEHFLRFAARLGDKFTERVRFRYDNVRKELGHRFIDYRRFGMTTLPKRVSVGAYYATMNGLGRSADATDYKFFVEDFDEWLAFGGRRQAVRIHDSRPGYALPGVTDISDIINGEVVVLLEEKR